MGLLRPPPLYNSKRGAGEVRRNQPVTSRCGSLPPPLLLLTRVLLMTSSHAAGFRRSQRIQQAGGLNAGFARQAQGGVQRVRHTACSPRPSGSGGR